jgi:NRPS condensation-like uncharacterized protein
MNAKIPHRLPTASLDRMLYLNQQLDQQFHFVLEMEGRLDEDRLRQALRLAMDSEPVFGCRYVAGHRQPYWERRVDLDKLPLCEVIESSRVREGLARFVARQCDASLDPLAQICIVRGNSDTLCLKVNHTAVDGTGGKELLSLIASLYRALSTVGHGRVLKVVPNLASRSLWQLIGHVDRRSYWQAFRNKRREPVEDQWLFPFADRAERGALVFTLRKLGPSTFESLKAFAQRSGATLNDLFLAACFRALWEFLDFPPAIPQSIYVPVNARRYLPLGRTGAICNFPIPLWPTLERIPGEPFEKTVLRVREAMPQGAERKQRVLAHALLISLSHRFALPKVKQIFDLIHRQKLSQGCTTVTFTNNGVLIPEELDFGLPLRDAWQIRPAAFAPDLLFGVISFRKTLTFVLTYPSHAANSQDIEHFLDAFVGQLDGIEDYMSLANSRGSRFLS